MGLPVTILTCNSGQDQGSRQPSQWGGRRDELGHRVRPSDFSIARAIRPAVSAGTLNGSGSAGDWKAPAPRFKSSPVRLAHVHAVHHFLRER